MGKVGHSVLDNPKLPYFYKKDTVNKKSRGKNKILKHPDTIHFMFQCSGKKGWMTLSLNIGLLLSLFSKI